MNRTIDDFNSVDNSVEYKDDITYDKDVNMKNLKKQMSAELNQDNENNNTNEYEKDDMQSTYQTSNMDFKKVKSQYVLENKKNQIIQQDKHKKGRGFEPKGVKDYYIANAHLKKKF